MMCEQIRPKLEDCVAEQLSSEETIEVRSHLAQCFECSRVMERLQHLVGILQGVPEVDPRVGQRPRVARRFRPATVAAALVLGVGLFLVMRKESSEIQGEVSLNATGERVTSVLLGQDIRVESPVARVRIPKGRLIEATKGSIFQVQSPDRVVARAGRLDLDVTPGQGCFVVQTPLGEVQVTGTKFWIEIEEGSKMSGTQKVTAGVALVAVGLVSGAIVYHQAAQTTELKPGEGLVVRPGEPARKISIKELDGKLRERERDLLESRHQVAALEGRLRALQPASKDVAGVTPTQKKVRDCARLVIRARTVSRKAMGSDSTEQDQREMMKVCGELLSMAYDPEVAGLSEGKKFFSSDYVVALFEEAGLVKNDRDKEIILHTLAGLGDSIAKLEDKDLWSSEAALLHHRIAEDFMREVGSRFPNSQKALDEIQDCLGPGALGGSGAYGRGADQNTTTRERAADIVMTNWDQFLKLDEGARQQALAVAADYAAEYVTLRRHFDAQYDMVFMDLYLPRVKPGDWTNAQTAVQGWDASHPDWARRRDQLDREFIGLQIKHLKRLATLLPPDNKTKFQVMQLYVYHFPNLQD